VLYIYLLIQWKEFMRFLLHWINLCMTICLSRPIMLNMMESKFQTCNNLFMTLLVLILVNSNQVLFPLKSLCDLHPYDCSKHKKYSCFIAVVFSNSLKEIHFYDKYVISFMKINAVISSSKFYAWKFHSMSIISCIWVQKYCKINLVLILSWIYYCFGNYWTLIVSNG
jgi:hypothetical protein